MTDVLNDEFAVDTGRTFSIPTNAERLAILLNALTFQELLDGDKQLKTKIAEVAAAERTKLVESATQIAAHFGLTPTELFAVAGKTKRAAKKVAKYVHPETGKAWSGNGRKPGWVADWLASGNGLDGLAV